MYHLYNETNCDPSYKYRLKNDVNIFVMITYNQYCGQHIIIFIIVFLGDGIINIILPPYYVICVITV